MLRINQWVITEFHKVSPYIYVHSVRAHLSLWETFFFFTFYYYYFFLPPSAKRAFFYRFVILMGNKE